MKDIEFLTKTGIEMYDSTNRKMAKLSLNIISFTGDIPAICQCTETLGTNANSPCTYCKIFRTMRKLVFTPMVENNSDLSDEGDDEGDGEDEPNSIEERQTRRSTRESAVLSLINSRGNSRTNTFDGNINMSRYSQNDLNNIITEIQHGNDSVVNGLNQENVLDNNIVDSVVNNNNINDNNNNNSIDGTVDNADTTSGSSNVPVNAITAVRVFHKLKIDKAKYSDYIKRIDELDSLAVWRVKAFPLVAHFEDFDAFDVIIPDLMHSLYENAFAKKLGFVHLHPSFAKLDKDRFKILKKEDYN